MILISDALINLINATFNKSYKTLIKQSSKIKVSPVLKKILFMLSNGLGLGWVLSSFASLLDYKFAASTAMQAAASLATAKSFLLMGAISFSTPIIFSFGMSLLTSIKNFIDQINIRSAYDSFNNLTSEISSYSFIKNLKNYFFIHQSLKPYMQDLKSKDYLKVQQGFNKISKNIDLENLSIFTPILDELSYTSLLLISASEKSSEKSKKLAEKLELQIKRKNELTKSAEDSSDVSILTLEREEETDSLHPLPPKENLFLQSKAVSCACW